MKKDKYFYRENFTGVKNRKVLFLLKIIKLCSFLMGKCNGSIKKIQKNCNHEFYLSDQMTNSHGRYDRTYICPKCSAESNGD